MNRADILSTAAQYVTADRAATHGDAERNFEVIATYWAAHLDHPVTSSDVAVMMTLLKLARIKSNPAHADNWVDGCGYLACGGEIAVEASARDESGHKVGDGSQRELHSVEINYDAFVQAWKEAAR